ncbi:hypothetical protein [Campylobacter porcelli]|uniref:Uncharacterized protein n=2 Tax=Campylobacter TaxID=194 RepID=A0ABU7M4I9_9BACT|nr:hypothetical protein [Campylobacter sp. P0124]MEE3744615.1 hypothetical protein [Campylobacter sp. CX2-4855-23]MEE3776465.1 hypothetical protein [Campylobacter sp. CX2-4080-23]
MLFTQGCSTKETLITTPVRQEISFNKLIADLPYMDFNRTARSEQEASLMAWDLYLYIKELEGRLERLRDGRE